MEIEEVIGTIVGLIIIVCAIVMFVSLDTITKGNATGLFMAILGILGITGGLSLIYVVYKAVT